VAIFAVIENGIQINTVVAETALKPNWVDITNMLPRPSNGWLYADGVFQEPNSQLVAVQRPNHITVGSLKDRMGMDALAIAVSSHPVCVALREMLYDRKFIDLDRPQTSQFLDMLINASQPAADPNFPGSGPMTEAKKSLILSTNIQEMERP
jgi:hypothetical protein